MKWKRLLRVCRRHRTPAPPVTDTDLQRMRADTEASMADAQARDPEVREVAARHREHGARNHFGDLFMNLLEGGRGDV
ncbi:hypothetical protein Q7689_00890 [Nocardiopsis tropica]|uniref:DUF7620 family protein n=1 Tax=Nocardiopsis tropica TaxID=109330 RepID=UPI002E8B3C7D|nr:hypothetical protein [Nocardiopsis tropica]